MSGMTAGLRGLLGRLQAFSVDWRFSFVPTENEEYEPGIDREVADLDEANVISSVRKLIWGRNDELPDERTRRHAVLLDLDYPAHLIESSTPGHFHLYLDVPNGVPHKDYMELLDLLARCGVIERGYADVSIARGHSDLRLPWVHKSDQKVHQPGPNVNLADASGAPATTPDDLPF
jgi:hypothetical protein